MNNMNVLVENNFIKNVNKKIHITNINDEYNEIEGDEYNEIEVDDFKKKLGKNTFGLDKVIPWEEYNFVFSGGLLFDIITDRFNSKLVDIDLFFFGSTESKISTINKLLKNLAREQYSYLMGYNNSVIYIFIQGIPRIIQLVMTNEFEPISIISKFDMIHLMSYTDGKKIYCSKKTLNYLKTKNNDLIEYSGTNKWRILKYFERDIVNEKKIFSTYNWILNNFNSEKYLREKKQIKLYEKTWNLTKYPNGEQIDFNKFNKQYIYLHDFFGCKCGYDKDSYDNFDNKDFIENIDMFGSFAKYVRSTEKIIINENCRDNIKFKIYNIETEINKFSLNKCYGYLYSFEDQRSLYIPCNLVKIDTINVINDNLKVLKMYFKIYDCNVIQYLLHRIKKYLILTSIESNIKNLDVENLDIDIDNNIFMPFNIEQNYEVPKELEICAKLYNYDIDNFIELNEYGIINNIEPSQKLYCLFDFDVYLNCIIELGKRKIKYIDVNLKPQYIYKKK